MVNLFPADITTLGQLVTLSSYDRFTNMDDVLIPDAAGCQSVFTVPYNERFKEHPKSVVGLMDMMARNYVPKDMIIFSMPANRFVEMANNIKGSFLDKHFTNPKGF